MYNVPRKIAWFFAAVMAALIALCWWLSLRIHAARHDLQTYEERFKKWVYVPKINDNKSLFPVTEYFERLAIEMKPKFDQYLVREREGRGPEKREQAPPDLDVWNRNPCGTCRRCVTKKEQLYILFRNEEEVHLPY